MESLLGHRLKVLLGVAVALVVLLLVYLVRGILAPFVLAFLLAYVLTPFVDTMEARGIKRTAGILLMFLGILLVLAALVVSAGSRMTGQMMDLSKEFLRQESSSRQLVITNRGNRAWPIVAVTTTAGEDNPFFVLEPEGGRAILEPGRETTLRLLFAPRDVNPVEGALALQLEGVLETVPFSIPLRGNGAGEEEKGFWARQYAEPGQWGKLSFSVQGLDFGMAGPNVITQISASARQLQPIVQPYLGGETDLASLVETYGTRLMGSLLGRTTDLLGRLFSGIMLLAIVPFVAFFFLKEGRRITHGIVELVPNAYFEMTLNLLYRINNQIGGYIRGQLVEVLIVAGLSVGGLAVIGMPYSVPVGILAGLANMIPYLGPIVGIAAATLVALTTHGGMAMVVKVVVLFFAIQMIDNILVQPMVVAKSVDLHPLIVLVVVMIGSDVGGMVGMLVAVPLTGILKVSVQTLYEGLKEYRVT